MRRSGSECCINRIAFSFRKVHESDAFTHKAMGDGKVFTRISAGGKCRFQSSHLSLSSNSVSRKGPTGGSLALLGTKP